MLPFSFLLPFVDMNKIKMNMFKPEISFQFCFVDFSFCRVGLKSCSISISDSEHEQGRHILYPLKAPITTAADDIHKYIFIVFQRK